MSSRSVQIKDQNEQLALVDKLSNGIHVASIIQQLMHAGKLFAVSTVNKGIMNGTSIDILLRTGVNPAHASLRMTADGTADLKVFEAPTTSADGTPLLLVARNRVTSVAIGVLVFAGPTVSTTGLLLLDEIVPPSGIREVQGLLADEIVMRPSTDYLLRLSNTSGGNINVGFVIDLFESILSDFN